MDISYILEEPAIMASRFDFPTLLKPSMTDRNSTLNTEHAFSTTCYVDSQGDSLAGGVNNGHRRNIVANGAGRLPTLDGGCETFVTRTLGGNELVLEEAPVEASFKQTTRRITAVIDQEISSFRHPHPDILSRPQRRCHV
ncbi:hypothetical protein [Halalkalicoccus salilacus]|uniref:hypothetical protein n=1 Tax=Halalkalicoccus salilacus TaxID=3117459 RepID=UPI00300F0878